MHYKRSLQCSPKKKKTLLQIRVLREKWSSKPPQLLCNHRKTQLKHCIWSWNIECYVALLESCKSEFSTLKKKYTSRERGPQWTPCVKNTKCFFCFYSSHLFDFYLFQSVFFFFFWRLCARYLNGPQRTAADTSSNSQSAYQPPVRVIRNGSNPLNIVLDSVFCPFFILYWREQLYRHRKSVWREGMTCSKWLQAETEPRPLL